MFSININRQLLPLKICYFLLFACKYLHAVAFIFTVQFEGGYTVADPELWELRTGRFRETPVYDRAYAKN